MGLRAKKPEVQQTRLKVLLYADKGAGKTHFCCSMPDTYYIDTEGLEHYPKFVEMIKKSNGDLIYLTELSEIIKEVKELLSTKHTYKTLVIDSLSFPYAWLGQLEAERLAAKTKGSEGTEYGANLAKAKRYTFQLGILLSRLDMNVIAVSHEKIKYSDGQEIGKTFDINEKMAYSLGSVWHLRLQGKNRKLFIEKSRYSELPNNELIDFESGYDVIKSLFGEEIFKRESVSEDLATPEQVKELNNLIVRLNISEELVNKWLMSAKAQSIEFMSSTVAKKCIDHLFKQLKGDTNE